MARKTVLHEFFAVTVSRSVYRVTDEMKDGFPLVEKVLGDNPASPAMKVGDRLRNGQLVGIGSFGITMFTPHPKQGRKFEDISSQYYGGSTSKIVALFLTLASARLSLEQNDLKLFDRRFIEQTKIVLKEIGDDHSVFHLGSTLQKALEDSAGQ